MPHATSRLALFAVAIVALTASGRFFSETFASCADATPAIVSAATSIIDTVRFIITPH